MIIGFGPHAKRIYFPTLTKLEKDFNLGIKVVVDLESKKEDIENFLSVNKHTAKSALSVIFLPDREKRYDKIPSGFEKKLTRIVLEQNINAVVISTEPMAHVQYARWALKNNLHIIMDKPLSVLENVSTDAKMAKKMIKEYETLSQELDKKRVAGNFLVFDLMAQRRFHPGFLLVRNLIREVSDRTNMPVSSITSVHSDGQWRMPSEIVDQDYHPYNQGYGKCSHSGYHTIDVAAWLLETTTNEGKKFDNVDVFSNFLRPDDFYEQLNLEDYQKIFPDYQKHNKYPEVELKKRFADMGEIDALVSLNFKRKNKTMALANLSMIHNGMAQRNWPTAIGRDLYKGNGRIRHESHYIVQGPFQAISFVSYQSKEIDPNIISNDLYETGGEYHLDIHVFRNSTLFPDWTAHKKYTIKDLGTKITEGKSRGHQEDARKNCLVNFLTQIKTRKTNDESSLDSHKMSISLQSAVYQSAAARYKGQNPLINIRS